MTEVKLSNGTGIQATDVELVRGVLKISTTDLTVEELAALFSEKENTSLITLYSENGTEIGYKTGFTSFAGITYGTDGLKVVELFQPKDVTELRLANAEAEIAKAQDDVSVATQEIDMLTECVLEMSAVVYA